MSDANDVDLKDPVGDADHCLGRDDAPLTLVEYGDYECPGCLETYPSVERLIRERGGSLRFVFRHFPLTSVHPHAGVAAQAAEAAGAQGKFWPMHRLLYDRRDGLELDDLDHMALTLGLEVYRFQSDLTTRRWAAKVQRQAEGGEASGVDGTPTFFLNGRRVSGASYEDLAAATEVAAT